MVIISPIVEYDIKNAGTAIFYDKGIIDKKRYDELLSMEKLQRNIQIGLMIKETPELSKIRSDGIKKAVEKFIAINKISNHNILEIANDAVWVVGRSVHKVHMSENIEFIKKQEFTSLFKYNKRMLIYLNSTTDTIKSRGFKIEKNEKLCDIIKEILNSYEYNDKDSMYELCHETIANLKEDDLYYGPKFTEEITNASIISKLMKDVL